VNNPVTWGDYLTMEFAPLFISLLFAGGGIVVLTAVQVWKNIHCRKCGARLKYGFMCPNCFKEE
jgi:hypothetical protein